MLSLREMDRSKTYRSDLGIDSSDTVDDILEDVLLVHLDKFRADLLHK